MPAHRQRLQAIDPLAAVPEDYVSSRQRFREVAVVLDAELHSFELASYQQGSQHGNSAYFTTPAGEPLTMDVAIVGQRDARRMAVVSCGLHGVEAFFGGAVIHHWMASLAAGKFSLPKDLGVVLLHALNPWGFAWQTRVNEDNVDPNRNFLLPGEEFRGAPAMYAQLDPLLNPPYLPSRWEPLRWKLLWTVLRHGMAALKQAVAGGQYEYPQGLFFGGHGPTATQRFLADQLPALAGHSELVVHIDYHTGLGRRGDYAMLSDVAFADDERDLLATAFGAELIREPLNEDNDYETRGALGRWCRHLMHENRPGAKYLTVGAEFGTYPPLNELIGLREENLTRQHLPFTHPRRIRARARLRELFCPASAKWRSWAIPQGAQLIQQTVNVLQKQG